jgi:hypothetical protein
MCLMVIGGIIQAVGTIASAQAQSASYKAQAKYAERQAVMEGQKGAYEAARQRDRNNRQLATMRGAYLSSGIALAGSPDQIIQDSATEASLDEQAIKYGAKVKSDNLRFESQLARMNARSAMTGGVIGAIGSVVNGFTQQAQAAAGSSMLQTSVAQQRTMIRNPYQF